MSHAMISSSAATVAPPSTSSSGEDSGVGAGQGAEHRCEQEEHRAEDAARSALAGGAQSSLRRGGARTASGSGRHTAVYEIQMASPLDDGIVRYLFRCE